MFHQEPINKLYKIYYISYKIENKQMHNFLALPDEISLKIILQMQGKCVSEQFVNYLSIINFQENHSCKRIFHKNFVSHAFNVNNKVLRSKISCETRSNIEFSCKSQTKKLLIRLKNIYLSEKVKQIILVKKREYLSQKILNRPSKADLYKKNILQKPKYDNIKRIKQNLEMFLKKRLQFNFKNKMKFFEIVKNEADRYPDKRISQKLKHRIAPSLMATVCFLDFHLKKKYFTKNDKKYLTL